MFALWMDLKTQNHSQKQNKEVRSLHCDLFIVGNYSAARHLVAGEKKKERKTGFGFNLSRY